MRYPRCHQHAGAVLRRASLGLALLLGLAGVGHATPTGGCGNGVRTPSTSYSATSADEGYLFKPDNAGGSLLSVTLPTPASVASNYTICGTSSSNKSVVFDVPLLAAPGTPALSSTSGGSLGSRTEYYKLTYVNATGETVGSGEQSIALGSNTLGVVATPGSFGNATGYNVYAASSSGGETKQNASPIALNTNWTEPTGGLISGSALPSSGTAASAYILDANQSLNALTVGPLNGLMVKLISDGTNFLVDGSSPQALAINGGLATVPAHWVYPGGPGYSATVGDSGNVISSAMTSGGLVVTLPSTTAIPGGSWLIGLDANGEPLSVQVNGTSGGDIVLPDGSLSTAYTLPAQGPAIAHLQFDGANFRFTDLPVAQVAKNMLDVFLVAGQSNAQGAASDGSGGPTVPTGQALQYYDALIGGTGAITDANDPVGNADVGSAWPSFGLYYNALTGRKVLIVTAAVGNTQQCAAADPYAPGTPGNWDSTGTMFAQSITILNDAIVAAQKAGYTVNVRGVIWSQGENDAGAITASSGAYTAADYLGCFQAMIARYRAATIGGATYPRLPFYISETGGPRTGDGTAYQQIRTEQEAVGEDDPYTQIAFRNAVDFIARGMMCDGCGGGGSQLHYEQSGYNEMGRVIAANIVSGQPRTLWQRGGDNSYGYGTGDLYETSGKATLGSAAAGADELNSYNLTDGGAGTFAGGFVSSVAAGTDSYNLRLVNAYSGSTLDQRVGLYFMPSWASLGDTYGSAIIGQQDQATGRGNLIFGGYAAGAWMEWARFGYNGGLTIGGYQGNANGGALGPGTLGLYNSEAAGRDNNLLVLLNKEGNTADQRVGILLNPTNLGDLTYGRGIIVAADGANGRGDMRIGGLDNGTWQTQVTIFHDGGVVFGTSTTDPTGPNVHMQGDLTVDGGLSITADGASITGETVLNTGLQDTNTADWSATSNCGSLASSTKCLALKDPNGNSMYFPAYGTY